jgi:excisionase family DNA binding protein
MSAQGTGIVRPLPLSLPSSNRERLIEIRQMGDDSEMDDSNRPTLLRVPEAARELGVSRSKTYQLIAAGQLPTIRIGASIRVNRKALEQLIEDRTSRPVAVEV